MSQSNFNPNDSFTAYFGNLKVQPNVPLRVDQVQAPPVLYFRTQPDTHYTIVIQDIDSKPKYINSLVVNTTEDAAYYVPPFKNHYHIIKIYKQRDGKIAIPSVPIRGGFELEEFAKRNNLKPIHITGFKLYGGMDNPGTGNVRGGYSYNREDYFDANVPLSERQQSFCRCTLHVMAKNSEECNRSHAYGSGKCYNPYAVCAKTTGTTTRDCSQYYNWNSLPDPELQAYLELHGLPASSDRSQMLQTLRNWKSAEQ